MTPQRRALIKVGYACNDLCSFCHTEDVRHIDDTGRNVALKIDRAAELAAKGVTRLVVPGFLFWRDPEESLARFGEEVVAPLAEV